MSMGIWTHLSFPQQFPNGSHVDQWDKQNKNFIKYSSTELLALKSSTEYLIGCVFVALAISSWSADISEYGEIANILVLPGAEHEQSNRLWRKPPKEPVVNGKVNRPRWSRSFLLVQMPHADYWGWGSGVSDPSCTFFLHRVRFSLHKKILFKFWTTRISVDVCSWSWNDSKNFTWTSDVWKRLSLWLTTFLYSFSQWALFKSVNCSCPPGCVWRPLPCCLAHTKWDISCNSQQRLN